VHVALLSHEYPPFIFGGVGTSVSNLARGLKKKGVEVTIISGYPVFSPATKNLIEVKRKSEEMNVIRLPYLNIPPRHIIFQGINLKRLYNAVKSLDVDIIHAQSGCAFPALLSLKNLAPVVVTFHTNPKTLKTISSHSLTRGGSIGDIYTYLIGYPIWTYTYGKEFKGSDVSVAVSRTLMEELTSQIRCNGRRKTRWIYNGVDIESLEKECPVTCLDTREEPMALFGGRLYWSKGVLNLLELGYLLQEKYHCPLRIAIHGSGPLSKRIKSGVKNLGLNNIVLQEFNRAEFMKNMRKASFIVIPSFYEACPMLLLEGMCLGKIPVMFDLPYAREFTKNGKYGILTKNIRDMAAKIAAVCEKGDEEHVGKEMQEYARERYDINETASKYLGLYRELLN
jgi:glycosyltransferase involved in cell wall biosynthesis